MSLIYLNTVTVTTSTRRTCKDYAKSHSSFSPHSHSPRQSTLIQRYALYHHNELFRKHNIYYIIFFLQIQSKRMSMFFTEFPSRMENLSLRTWATIVYLYRVNKMPFRYQLRSKPYTVLTFKIKIITKRQNKVSINIFHTQNII